MAKIVECIPNFSEGRNQAVIDGLVEVAKSVPGVTLLDHSSDASHNRSVFTLVGDDQNIQEVAFRLVKYASENIDLTKHQGEHPRMGATDVLPFVPIKDITSEECVEIAKTVSERINRELGIPIFLYEDAATRPERKNLAKVRKGQFEGMPEKLLEPDWAPDYGERKIHPTAGVTAVGARMPLIAYNINLDTDNLEIANNIAKISDNIGIESLPVDLQEVAQLRIQHPDYSIQQLADSLSRPLTKSGVNHRLRKINKIADEL